MSHLVSIKTRVTDPVPLAGVCRRLGLAEPVQGTATLFAGQLATGLAKRSSSGSGDLARLLDAAAGLTRYEAEGAFALSLVRHGRLDPKVVWELKEGTLKKAGLLTLHRGDERFAGLGGLDAVKQFCGRALAARNAAARPRGILLLRVPGSGKSAICKALGNETGRPTPPAPERH